MSRHWLWCGLLCVCCVGGSQRQTDVQFQQYYAEGEGLYLQHCANCHQTNGAGLGRVYPPLANSDYIKDNAAAVVCLMKYGIKDELVVNGVRYNKPMPGIPTLTNLELAELATYIANSWGNSGPMVHVSAVPAIIENCNPQ
ncbi:MAG: cytochrome c [Cyclobacteriaceae bacterium]|nr:cytochrome c [Cyclobacteriaceae bacterium]